MTFALTLNRRIRLLTPTVTSGTSGEQIAAWNETAILWASVRFLSGLESIRSGAITEALQASIRIRRRPGITAALRVVYDGVTYNVKSVQPDDRRVWIDLVCESVPV